MSHKVHIQSSGAPNGWNGYQWDTTESVVAVPYEDALQILQVPHAGFYEAAEYDARPPAVKATAPVAKAAAAKRGRGRPKANATDSTLDEALELTSNEQPQTSDVTVSRNGDFAMKASDIL